MGTRFPWLPMLAIAIGLVSHSYALTSLFPYVGYMVQHLGVTHDKDEAGYYAGYVSSAFMVGRFGSSYFWGRFADTHGRLPVIYVGLSSMVVMSVAFGLSTTFVQALVCRFLLGMTNGLLGISKTMISEVCGKEHEVVGMASILGCGSIGLVIGPGLGGLLAEPATHYPTVFSESGLFGRHVPRCSFCSLFPYLLPNLVGASIALMGLPMVFFFLKETKHLHNGKGGSRGAVVETPEIGDEEGAMLEMLPLTQGDSLEGGGSDSSGRGVNDKGLVDTNLESARAVGDDGDVTATQQRTTGRDERGDGAGASYDGLGVGDIDRDHVGDSNDENHRLLVSSRGAKRRPSNGQLSNLENGGVERTRINGDSLRRDMRGSAFGEKASKPEGLDEGRGGATGTLRRMLVKSACSRECLVPIRLLEERRTRSVMFVYAVFSFVTIGSREVYPLWALSTVASGGLDWTTKQIGQALSTCGVFMLFFQLLVYPRLSKRIGVTKSQRCACFLSIPVFLAFPLLSYLRHSERGLIAASLVLLFMSNMVANMVFINVSLATNNAVDPSRRATLNGLSMTLGSLAKAAGPTFFSSIFAWSIDGESRPFPLDHHLAFYLLALGMVVVSWGSWDTIVSPEPVATTAATSAVGARTEGVHRNGRKME
ncbi:unnamed protein product, partial [Hapterophycus canaliculatus]